MARAFSSEQITELNKLSHNGVYFEAVVFSRDLAGTVKDRFSVIGKPIIYQGEIYSPLAMTWDGLKISSGMEIPTNSVTVTNLDGSVSHYLEDDTLVISGNDCLLQILFMDKQGDIHFVDEMLYQMEVAVADYHRAATFHMSVNFSLNDIIPRETLEKNEFPGMRDDFVRVGT